MTVAHFFGGTSRLDFHRPTKLVPLPVAAT